MADGRGDRRGSGSGGEEGYDWLYQGRNSPRGSRPLDTPPSFIAPASPGGRSPSGRRSTRRGRRPRFRFRWLRRLLLAWVVFLVAVPVYAWTTVSTVDAEPAGERAGEQPGTNYLVVGSDERAGLSGRRTDTIMLLHTGSGPNLLLSVPRDSLVEVPGHGTDKVNAAFAFGGPKLLVQTMEGATGIRVDHYVEIGFRGFVKLVDAVGGIQICPETAMKDEKASLDIPQGCQEADGATALGYARSRQTQQLGDIDRARHQREVVSAIGSEIASWQTVVNPVRYWNVVTSGAESVRVSDGTGPLAAGRFALGMARVDGSSGLTCGVPILDLAVNWDPERSERLFQLIREDRTAEVTADLCRPTGMPEQ